ncbi:MAG: OmpA family protein [Campylobacterota bacterium]|nr:OmpA family protein [Campylobacterota bacterium]
MKRTYKSLLVGLCAVALLAGCSSKDVEYEGTNSAVSQNQNAADGADSKVDQIAGSESVVESNSDTISSNNIDEDSISNNSGINSVKSDINGEVVSLQSVHFSFDKYILSDEMREIATSNATKIDTTTQSYSNLKIKLEGNCDEWGTDEYNYALGLKRAKTAKDALIADGVSESKIMLVSFGESNPICNDRNVACWKMNRRVDYRLLP